MFQAYEAVHQKKTWEQIVAQHQKNCIDTAKAMQAVHQLAAFVSALEAARPESSSVVDVSYLALAKTVTLSLSVEQIEALQEEIRQSLNDTSALDTSITEELDTYVQSRQEAVDILQTCNQSIEVLEELHQEGMTLQQIIEQLSSQRKPEETKPWLILRRDISFGILDALIFFHKQSEEQVTLADIILMVKSNRTEKLLEVTVASHT